MVVLVCGGDSPFQRGLGLLLQKLNPAVQVLLAACPFEAARERTPYAFDLVLVDAGADAGSQHNSVMRVREAIPLAPIAALADRHDPGQAHAALAHGASSLIPKQLPPPLLADALNQVLLGRTYVRL